MYFFYLKKDHQENGFPNIISTNVKYNNNIITVRYTLNEPNLNHNKIYCNYSIDIDNYEMLDDNWKETNDNECIIKVENKGKYYIYLKNENEYIYIKFLILKILVVL